MTGLETLGWPLKSRSSRRRVVFDFRRVTRKRLPFRGGVLNTGLGRSVDRVRPVGGLLLPLRTRRSRGRSGRLQLLQGLFVQLARHLQLVLGLILLDRTGKLIVPLSIGLALVEAGLGQTLLGHRDLLLGGLLFMLLVAGRGRRGMSRRSGGSRRRRRLRIQRPRCEHAYTSQSQLLDHFASSVGR